MDNSILNQTTNKYESKRMTCKNSKGLPSMYSSKKKEKYSSNILKVKRRKKEKEKPRKWNGRHEEISALHNERLSNLTKLNHTRE